MFRFDIDLEILWSNIRNSDPLLYSSAVAVYYLAFLLRGLRWRMLVRNAGVEADRGERMPSVMQCSEGILLGWFINSITLLRLGDVYRGQFLNQNTNLKFPKSMGTVVAERVVDSFVVFSLLAVSTLVFLGGRESQNIWLILGFASIMLLVALVGIAAMKYLGLPLARVFPPRIQTWYHQFHQGTLGSLRQIPAIFALSILIWMVDSSRLLLVLYAMDLRGVIDLSFGFLLLFVLFAALAHSLLTIIPLTPGGLGFVEAGLAAILAIEMSRNDALAVALVERSITYASIIFFGALVYFSLQLRRRQMTPISDMESR